MRNVTSRILAMLSALTIGLCLADGALTSAQGQSVQPGPFNTVPTISTQPIGIPYETGSIIVGKNVNVTNEPGAQSETGVAVDPTDPKHLIMSLNDLNALSGAAASVYESTDGGLTFKSTYVSPSGLFCYDTWDGFNSSGDAFVSYECGDQRIAYRKKGQQNWTEIVFNN